MSNINVDGRTWQDIFAHHSVADIYTLNGELASRAGNKKLELRQLVGQRYKDLLRTSDRITQMYETATAHDAVLTELCSVAHYARWANDDSNVSKFYADDTAETRSIAVEQLLNSLLQLVARQLPLEDGNLVVARSLYLCEVILSSHSSDSGFESRTAKYRDMLLVKLKGQLLKGSESAGATEALHPVNLFLSYMIVEKLSPQQALANFFSSRQAAINSVISAHPSADSLLACVRMTGSALAISHQAYSQNQLHRLAAQQASVYRILDSPEFAQHPELFKKRTEKWLPDEVRASPCLAVECTQSIEHGGRSTAVTKKAFTDATNEFLSSVVLSLASSLDAIFSSISSLDTLIDLYASMIDLLRDTRSPRALRGHKVLHGNTETAWFHGIFESKWSERFCQLGTATIHSLAAIDKDINKAIDGLSSLNGVSAFHPDSNLFVSLTESSMDSLFVALDDISKGRVGDVRDLAYRCETWYQDVTSISTHIEAYTKLKSRYSGPAAADDAPSLDDEDFDDEWKLAGERVIAERSKEFGDLVSTQVRDVYASIQQSLETHVKGNSTSQAAAFVVKVVLALEGVFQRFDRGLTYDSLLADGYKQLATHARQLVAYSGNPRLATDFTLWDEDRVLGKLPSAPSLTLVASLSELTQKATSEFGWYHALWSHPKARDIQNAIGERLADLLLELNSLYREAEVARDSKPEASDEVETEQKTEAAEEAAEEGAEEADEETATADVEAAEKTTETVEETSAGDEAKVSHSAEPKEAKDIPDVPDSKVDEPKADEAVQPPSKEEHSLQTYADVKYVEVLFELSTAKSTAHAASSKILPDVAKLVDGNIVEAVARTRLLFSPLAP